MKHYIDNTTPIGMIATKLKSHPKLPHGLSWYSDMDEGRGKGGAGGGGGGKGKA